MEITPAATPEQIAALDGTRCGTGTVILAATEVRRIHGLKDRQGELTHVERDGQMVEVRALRDRSDLEADVNWFANVYDRRYYEVVLEDGQDLVLWYDQTAGGWFEDTESPRGEAADARLRKIAGPMTLEPKRSLRHNPHG
jgi:hypothetical protein